MQMHSRNFFSNLVGNVSLTAPRSGHPMKLFKHFVITETKVLHIYEIFAAFPLNLFTIFC